jgi:TniQ
MMPKASSHQLPVHLPSCTDELLSSWVYRHASFYAVSPLVMLEHSLPEISSLRAADLDLNLDHASRLASVSSIEPGAVQSITFAKVARSSRRLIGAKPLQPYPNCCPAPFDCRPILRSQFRGWRITCPLCGELLNNKDGREVTYARRPNDRDREGFRMPARARAVDTPGINDPRLQ